MPDTYDVAISGAGPAGLTLAIELGQRGIRTLLLERNAEPGPWPKMERCNARSMEFYRRLGLADRIRAVGFTADSSMDVFLATSLDQPPITSFPFDTVAQYRARIADCTDGSLPLEPYQLVSQYALEPVLKAEAESLPSLDVRFGHEVLDFEQDVDGVTINARDLEGTEITFHARFLAACDGGSSPVRKALGIKLEGDGRLQRLSQVQFFSDTLYDRIPMGKGRHYYMADGSSFVVQGNRKHFTLHSPLPADSDFATEIRRLIPLDFDLEVLRVNSWNLNLLVAERYRDGRVFLVGDAVHLVIPMGGLGMNTAVGDATDLAWKLAGAVQGWGGPGLLDSYEIERRPVGLMNRDASRFAAEGLAKWRRYVTQDIYSEGATGEAARIEIARLATVYQLPAHEMHGAELGYHYAGSPLVAPTDGPPPSWEVLPYVPSTRPGARLPHMWLEDGTAIFDLCERSYVFLNLGAPVDTAALAQSFAARAAPFQLLTLDQPHLRRVYGRRFLLLRPDLHIAWRGDEMPSEPEELAATVVGAAIKTVIGAATTGNVSH